MSRWLTWQPGEKIFKKNPTPEPSEITKTNFDGFDSPLPGRSPNISQPDPPVRTLRDGGSRARCAGIAQAQGVAAASCATSAAFWSRGLARVSPVAGAGAFLRECNESGCPTIRPCGATH